MQISRVSHRRTDRSIKIWLTTMLTAASRHRLHQQQETMGIVLPPYTTSPVYPNASSWIQNSGTAPRHGKLFGPSHSGPPARLLSIPPFHSPDFVLDQFFPYSHSCPCMRPLPLAIDVPKRSMLPKPTSRSCSSLTMVKISLAGECPMDGADICCVTIATRQNNDQAIMIVDMRWAESRFWSLNGIYGAWGKLWVSMCAGDERPRMTSGARSRSGRA